MICPNCDRKIEDDAKTCEYCGKPLPEEETETPEAESEYYIEEPKPLMGFLGAVLGAIASGILIVLFGSFGMAPIAGMVVAFCVYVGYRLLSRTMTKIGLGVCIMLTLMTPYIADRVGWAIWMANNVPEIVVEGQTMSLEGLSLMRRFLIMPVALDAGKISLVTYYMGLFRLYLFTLVGGVAYYGTIFKRKKLKFKAPRL